MVWKLYNIHATIPMFEYDPGKSSANLAKHGIDFDGAQAVWSDPLALMVPARSETEPRFAVVGVVGGRHWTVFATMRGEAIRIISARRSRTAEVAYYERQETSR